MKRRILILGATGRTGNIALKLALERNYDVTILVRDPEQLNLNTRQVTIIKGTPTHIDDLRKAMVGCNAIISFLAALPDKKMITLKKIQSPDTLKTSIQNTITVMGEQNVNRIMILSAVGTGDSFKYLPWFIKQAFKLTNMSIVFDDHHAQEQLVQKSDFDWTIVRAVGLSDHQEPKKVVVDLDTKPENFKISRKHVAQFFIDNLFFQGYFKRTVMISEKKAKI